MDGTTEAAQISPAPKCIDCLGRGWVTPNVDRDHPRFGEIIRCHCQPPVDTKRLIAFTELTPGLRAHTFEALGLAKTQNTDQAKDWRACVQIAYSYAKGRVEQPWLVFAGSIGWGKTHLGLAILNWRIDHPGDGLPGKFVNCPDFIASLRAGIDEGGFEQTLRLYREVPLLMLDDLGAEYQRRRGDEVTWPDEQIYRVMDHRYRERMPTIVTTNAPPERTPARLRDRLRDSAITLAFGLDLPSYRTGEVLR